MKKRLLRYLIAIVIVLPVVTIGAIYTALRSERFVIGYLLPFISEKAGTQIQASHSSIKLFSSIDLEGLSVGGVSKDSIASGKDPLSLSAKSLHLSYDFWSLLSKKLAITELKVDQLKVALLQGQTASESSAAPSAEPTLNQAPSSEKPGFAITLKDVEITNSAFKFSDNKAGAEYALDGISIQIPNGDSNGDSEIKLKFNASVNTNSLKLSNETISGALKLKDAAMFAPSAIDISAKVGKATPTPLEFIGALNFLKEPYGLNLVSINKALVRDTLLTTLSLPSGPIQSFEYELSGEYPLATGTPFNLKILVNKGLISPTSDLKGTKLSANLTLAADSLSANSSNLELITNGASAAKCSLSGNFAFDPFSKRSKLDLKVPSIDFDLIETALAPSNTPAPGESDAAPKASTTPEATPTPAAPQSASNAMKLPLIDAQVAIDRATYQKTGISDLKLDVSIPKNTQIDRAQLNAKFDGGGVLSLSAAGLLDQTVNFKAKAEKVNILPLAAAVQSGDELLEGNLELLDIDLSLAPNSPRTSITGRTRVDLSRFIVPSTLHGQVPFNILFLPFDALITVFGGTLNAILPKSISSISDGIRQVLDDAGRLGIEKGVIDLAFNQGEIACNKVEMDTKNLPDFNIKGKVTAKDGLDFTIFIALLKLNLPLPVAGTLSTPLPDVAYLGPEIVRGLGLSIGNIAGSAASLFGGGSSDDSSSSTDKPIIDAVKPVVSPAAIKNSIGTIKRK
jgi:hypothetical protein